MRLDDYACRAAGLHLSAKGSGDSFEPSSAQWFSALLDAGQVGGMNPRLGLELTKREAELTTTCAD
jgi:hypothetical protein